MVVLGFWLTRNRLTDYSTLVTFYVRYDSVWRDGYFHFPQSIQVHVVVLATFVQAHVGS